MPGKARQRAAKFPGRSPIRDVRMAAAGQPRRNRITFNQTNDIPGREANPKPDRAQRHAEPPRITGGFRVPLSGPGMKGDRSAGR